MMEPKISSTIEIYNYALFKKINIMLIPEYLKVFGMAIIMAFFLKSNSCYILNIWITVFLIHAILKIIVSGMCCNIFEDYRVNLLVDTINIILFVTGIYFCFTVNSSFRYPLFALIILVFVVYIVIILCHCYSVYVAYKINKIFLPHKLDYLGVLIASLIGINSKKYFEMSPEKLKLIPFKRYVKPKDANLTNDICSICSARYEENDIMKFLPCDITHIFHAKCIDDWLQTIAFCPLCYNRIIICGNTDIKNTEKVRTYGSVEI